MHSSYARASGEAFLASSVPPCMIVEDEPGTRTIISRALASHGLFACEFADIDAAISALQEAQPKIVFLNASLSGANTMAAIRGLADCCYAGAVQLISKHKPDTLDTVCKLGERHGLRMRSPIVKPFSADAIRVVVQDEGLANPVLAEQPVSLEEALRRG